MCYNPFIMLADCHLIITSWRFIYLPHHRLSEGSVNRTDRDLWAVLSAERLLPLRVSTPASRKVRGATERIYAKRDHSRSQPLPVSRAKELKFAR